jgi:Uma2 family endonuclease
MTASSSSAFDRPPVPVRRFSVPEYHRIGELGVLTDHDRVELLEGWIVPKMIHNPPHDNSVELIDEALRPLLPAGWRLRIQSSITTSDSEPEPDLVVVKGTARQRAKRHPEPAEVALVVEVADSSLETDRDTKARLYARAGVPRYWIVNLGERQLEMMSEPSGPAAEPAFAAREVARAGERVALIIDGMTVGHIEVSDLLP